MVHAVAADGRLQYMKELNPQIHSSGPCLSKAEYSAVTLDGSITSRLTVSGGRTDDLVRVFVDIHLEVVRDVSFSRLVFFQQSSETYSYHATHERFVWGGAGAATTSKKQTCNQGSRSGVDQRGSSMYGVSGLPVREAMSGGAPWWFAFENNTDNITIDTSSKVVGDRGLVVRSYSARLGGVQRGHCGWGDTPQQHRGKRPTPV